MGVGSHVSITLWCEFSSWGLKEGARSRCKPNLSPYPLFCYISLVDSLIWNTIFLPYSSCCFPYFLPYKNCLLLLSLKTQKWCMPTMHYAFHNSVNLTSLQLPIFNSRLLYQASLPYVKFSDCFHTNSCINILFFKIIIFFPKFNFHWYGS